MLKYTYEIYTRKNTVSEDKPNEDLAIIDEGQNIGMVLDGVSRDREDGKYPNPSPAAKAAMLFSSSILNTTKISESGISKIQAMISQGNSVLKEYNSQLNHPFPAGVVGVVFSIENEQFHYGYIGDCYAAFIRNDMMRVFTECQTEMVAKNKKAFTADEIRFDICNHVNHPCGYGVWNGDDKAIDFVKYGTIKVSEGDVLLIYSDGMKDVLDTMQLTDLLNLPLEHIGRIDVNTNKDDRTCIRIVFHKE